MRLAKSGDIGLIAKLISTFCVRERPVFAAGFLIILSFILTGCIGSTTTTSPSINTLFSSEQLRPSEKVVGLESQVKTSEPPSIPQPVQKHVDDSKESLSPAVKNALVPAGSSKTSAAEQAAVQLDKNNTANTSSDQTTTSLRQANATPPPASSSTQSVAKSNATKIALAAVPQRKPKNALAGFFKRSDSKNADIRRTSSNSKKQAKVIQRSRDARLERRTTVRSRKGSRSELPGVSLKRLFGIDTEEVDELDEPIQVASVANLARRGTHGLLLQHSGVNVGCFPRPLVRLLKKVERKFGRTPIVTSGYRSPAHNRRIRGARNSMHVHCKAADIQVQGVSKWTLAKYLRSIPGRGGVGTYCHTKSVHVDIAGKRDWNRRCKRRRGRRS